MLWELVKAVAARLFAESLQDEKITMTHDEMLAAKIKNMSIAGIQALPQEERDEMICAARVNNMLDIVRADLEPTKTRRLILRLDPLNVAFNSVSMTIDVCKYVVQKKH
jgi:hypothetical protein